MDEIVPDRSAFAHIQYLEDVRPPKKGVREKGARFFSFFTTTSFKSTHHFPFLFRMIYCFNHVKLITNTNIHFIYFIRNVHEVFLYFF